jgi:hypothetical protein
MTKPLRRKAPEAEVAVLCLRVRAGGKADRKKAG